MKPTKQFPKCEEYGVDVRNIIDWGFGSGILLSPSKWVEQALTQAENKGFEQGKLAVLDKLIKEAKEMDTDEYGIRNDELVSWLKSQLKDEVKK
jgi:hypothetical protein